MIEKEYEPRPDVTVDEYHQWKQEFDSLDINKYIAFKKQAQYYSDRAKSITKAYNSLIVKDSNKCVDDSWQTRFVNEYRELKSRYDKLDAMTVKYEAGTLTFEPNCSLELLKEQKKYMGQYLRCLKIRAEIENIDISEENK